METTSIPRRVRATATAAERIVPWLALLAAPTGLMVVLHGQRAALASVEWTFSWRVVALSTAAFAIAPLLQGLSFWLALRLLTGTTSLTDAMLVWSRSYVVRYAPTGALAIAYRLAARRRLHANAEQVLAAYGYEHVATLGAGAAACVLLFALAGGVPPWPALLISAGALALGAAVQPGSLGRLADRVGTRFGFHLSALLPARHVTALIALNCFGWLGTGSGVLLLVTSVTGDAPGFVWLVATYTAGYLVGFVTPLAPGGLGAREGMLVVLLRGRYGVGPAAAISVAIRVVNIVGELLAVALIHCAYGASVARRRARHAFATGAAGAEPA